MNSVSYTLDGLPQESDSAFVLNFVATAGKRKISLSKIDLPCGEAGIALAREWLWHSYHSDHTLNTAVQSRNAIRGFLSFMGRNGLKELSLVDDDKLIAQHFYAWEIHCSQHYGPESSYAKRTVNRVIHLFRFRRLNGRPMGPIMTNRSESMAAFGSRHTDRPLREYPEPELQGIIRIAKRACKRVEARLSIQSPPPKMFSSARENQTGIELEKLLDEARAGSLTTQAVKACFNADPERIDPLIHEWALEFGLTFALDSTRIWMNVTNTIYRRVNLTELDLIPFFALAIYFSGLTSGELKTMRRSTFERSRSGVSFAVYKGRGNIGRTVKLDRRRNATLCRIFESVFDLGESVFKGTDHGDLSDLFWVCCYMTNGRRHIKAADFHKASFGHWINLNQVDAAGPHKFDRLRKNHVSVRTQTSASLNDAVVDHSEQVFMRHYVSTDTLLRRTAHVVSRVQSEIFENAVVGGPVVIINDTARVVDQAKEAADLLNKVKNQSAVDRAMGVGICTMQTTEAWTTNERCLDPVAKCMVCRNAVIFLEHLPQVLALQDWLEGLRRVTPPSSFLERYGSALDNLRTIVGAFSTREVKAARSKLESEEEALMVPLEMRQ